MVEILGNTSTTGKPAAIGELATELKSSEGAGSKLKLLAAVPKNTGLREVGETRLAIETATGTFEYVKVATTATAWTEAEVLERGVAESTASNLPVGAKVYDVVLREALDFRYVVKSGLFGGQTIIGDTTASGSLILQSTSHATRGKVIARDRFEPVGEMFLNRSGKLVLDEVVEGLPTGAKLLEIATANQPGCIQRRFTHSGAGAVELEGFLPTNVVNGQAVLFVFDAGSEGTIVLANKHPIEGFENIEVQFNLSVGENIVLKPGQTILLYKAEFGWVDISRPRTVGPNSVGTEALIANAVTEAKLAEAIQRLLLGTAAATAIKSETIANAETGIIPSATKHALVSVSIKMKEESLAVETKVEANGVVVQNVHFRAFANDVVPIAQNVHVLPGKKIKIAKPTEEAKIENVQFSVQLMN